jgi:hypothetical protein
MTVRYLGKGKPPGPPAGGDRRHPKPKKPFQISDLTSAYYSHNNKHPRLRQNFRGSIPFRIIALRLQFMRFRASESPHFWSNPLPKPDRVRVRPYGSERVSACAERLRNRIKSGAGFADLIGLARIMAPDRPRARPQTREPARFCFG